MTGIHNDGTVCCVAGGEEYGLRGSDTREIVRAERMRKERGSDGQAGTIVVRGETVPVYDLTAVLQRGASGAQPPAQAGSYVVITEGAARPVGWLVDRIVRAAEPGPPTLLPLPAVIGPLALAWFQGLLRLSDRALLLLAPRRLDPRAAASPPAAGEHVTSGVLTAGALAKAVNQTTDGLPGLSAVEGSAAMNGSRSTDSSSQLVVLFSSAALPHCSATRYALSARRVTTVVPTLPVMQIPGSASHVAGVAVWRDAAMPVVDYRDYQESRDNPAGAAPERTRFIVAKCDARLGGAPVAFAVDPEVTLHRPSAADRQITDTTTKPPFVAGMFEVAGQPVALLDLEALLF